MLRKKLIYIFLYVITTGYAITEDASSLVVSLSPNEVINSFKAVVKSGFLNQLANEFATKAAMRLVQEMRKKGKQLQQNGKAKDDDDNKKPLLNIYNINRQWTPINDKSKKPEHFDHVLDEEEALALMQEPSPDGDDFEKSNLSDEEQEFDNATKKPVSVVGVMKINGMYFRRYPGHLRYLF